jgi:crotonobetainyl-CoA:carnitine CoA-transferase CaiB-like acyl-CoA transferase
MNTPARLPLDGVRVIEFTHMVMGPTCGMILADLGAEVIKIEPPGGDKTRKLPGLGIGFFRSFNRNKKSVVLDINTPEGHEAAVELIGTCDAMLENFRPGLMAKLGLDYDTLSKRYPGLIYVSHKGFLPGPYEKRLALDEVVQMMGGLSYMTGPVGRPLRAGTSVNDIMGGMFGAIGVLAALREREQTGRGQEVQSALFENCVFLSRVGVERLRRLHARRRRTAFHRRCKRQAIRDAVRRAGSPRPAGRAALRDECNARRDPLRAARSAGRDPEGASN